ncbi:MAG: TonB-dependent receptor domain-containing protein, partial [Vulcanimicrobiaceae bacterium]
APANADVRIGSFGDREVTAAADGFSFQRVVANNGYALPNDGTTPATRANADYEATSFHAGFDRALGSIEASLRAGLTSDHLGAPGPIVYFSDSSRENDVNGSASITLTQRRAHSTATLQLGGTRQQTTFGCDALNDPNCYQPVIAVSTESRTEFGLRNVVSGASERLIYGIDLARGVVRSDSGGTATPPISFNALAQAAAYAQENVQLGGDSSAYAGLRGERDGALGGEFSPSIGASTALGAGLVLKVNYAGAFRAPNASELYFPGYGNPALRPERARVGDVTLADDRLLGGVTLGWFTNRTNDLIVPVEVDPANFIYQPENIDRALLQGFTLDVHTRPFRGITAGLNVTDLYNAQDLVAQSRLPHDPVMSVNLRLGFNGGHTSVLHDAGIAFRSIGANATVDPTLPLFDQATAFTTVDAFARFRTGRHALLALRGYNLGNERYAQVAGYPMPGRSFALELTTR